MIFTELALAGAWLIDAEPRGDERGFLARTYDEAEFTKRGLCTRWVQQSTVFSPKAGTLRGMHFQRAPHEEIKLIRCTSGAVYDVIVDLRPDSPTYLRWVATELSAANRRSLYVPKGFAHGAQTLADDTELLYQMSAAYEPEAAAGVRWNDGVLGIAWAMAESMISSQDDNWALLPHPNICHARTGTSHDRRSRQHHE